MKMRRSRPTPLPAMLLSAALLLSVLPGPACDRAFAGDLGDEGRLVLGVTMSGHIMLHAGWEQFFADDLAWRAGGIWMLDSDPNCGWEIALQRRWTGGDVDPRRFVKRDNSWILSTGFLQLWARDDARVWKHLSLFTLSPGHRWGLGDGGKIEAEVPVCCFLAKRRLIPIGFTLRWQPD